MIKNNTLPLWHKKYDNDIHEPLETRNEITRPGGGKYKEFFAKQSVLKGFYL